MTNEQFATICNRYKGTITNEGKNTIFRALNLLGDKKVECELELTENGSLNGFEATYEIIGGFGFPKATEENLIRQLERYNFEKKEHEQLSLFEL